MKLLQNINKSIQLSSYTDYMVKTLRSRSRRQYC